jgi:hypothetical protein
MEHHVSFRNNDYFPIFTSPSVLLCVLHQHTKALRGLEKYNKNSGQQL